MARGLLALIARLTTECCGDQRLTPIGQGRPVAISPRYLQAKFGPYMNGSHGGRSREHSRVNEFYSAETL
jgi:hypothetical protein